MTRFTGLVIIFIFCRCMDPSAIRAQGFGGAGNSSERAGNLEGTWHPAGEAPLLPPENAAERDNDRWNRGYSRCSGRHPRRVGHYF